MIEHEFDCSKLYFKSEDGEYKELGATTELEFESNKNEEDAFTKAIRIGWSNTEVYVATLTYKKWYKKKKGKHFVRYYKIKRGFNPKIINLLIGDKYERRKIKRNKR